MSNPTGGGPPGRYGSTNFRERAPVQPKKRMMAQGRKGHFMHDAKLVMTKVPGKLDEQHVRAFLEGIFQRGTRQSTEAAQVFLEEKVKDGTVVHDQAVELGKLIDRYSFFR